MLTIVYSGAIVVLSIITSDLTDMSYVELQKSLYYVVLVSGFVSAFVTITFGLPKKMRNIFKEEAKYKIQRHENIRNQISSEINTTESLLLKYNLITQDDIDKRKSELSENRLI